MSAKTTISIGTTIRSSYRVKEQLKVVNDNFDGQEWNNDSKPAEFVIKIIQNKLFHSKPKGLTQKEIKEYEESDFVAFDLAKKIFENAYPPHEKFRRSRTNFGTFKKLGLVNKNTYKLNGKFGKLGLTSSGKELLKHKDNEVFLKIFLKWQTPFISPGKPSLYKEENGYNCIPFICFLQLLKKLNQLSGTSNGISYEELLFLPLLIVMPLREMMANLN